MPITEQITVVQNSMYPIVVTILSLQYDLSNKKYCYFNFSDEERDTVWSNFPKFERLKPTFLDVGQAVQCLEMDSVEVGFLCGIRLLSMEDGKSTVGVFL